MAKTAYLFTFHPTTRIIADPDDFKNEDELYEHLSKKAREKMLTEIENYLCGDNGEYEEDTECPFGTFYADKIEK